ncbi:MAG: hypothetical protein JXB30_17290 [Anaerolineae bacterium]|nr:hypothetical protein [Anaerolineae bacterium]
MRKRRRTLRVCDRGMAVLPTYGSSEPRGDRREPLHGSHPTTLAIRDDSGPPLRLRRGASTGWSAPARGGMAAGRCANTSTTGDVDDRYLHAMTTRSNDNKFSYAVNGNMISRTQNGVTRAQTFDAQNRLVSVSDGTTTTTYVYDGSTVTTALYVAQIYRISVGLSEGSQEEG